MRVPKQARSRQTLERMLAAARELLETKDFDEVAVADIAKRGRSSVGAFYARFEDKDGLLNYLDVFHAQEIVAAANEFGDETAPLEEVVRDMIGFAVRFHRQHAGLLRAMVRRGRIKKERRHAPRAQGMINQFSAFHTILLRHRKEITHANPDLALSLALSMVFNTIRERVLFPETASSRVPITNSILAEELSDSFLSYVCG